MQLGSSSRPGQCRVVHADIQGLVSCARLPASDKDLNVLRLVGCGLLDGLTFMTLGRMLTTDWGKEKSRAH